MTTRKFPTEVVLSLTTRRLMCKFSDMHELIEWLVKEPVFTHQLGSKPFVDFVVQKVFDQHPELRSIDEDSINSTNWEIRRDELVTVFGPEIALCQN